MGNIPNSNILATIDELNQYLNGNVTKLGLELALKELLKKVQQSKQ